MYVMKIKYYHTLYKMVIEENVFGSVSFKDGKVRFLSSGHGCEINVENVVSIEPIEQ